MTQYTPMIEQYLKIKAEYEDAFLFFRLGDFYEMFFEDAIEASRELEITLTGRVGGGKDKIPMCGVPYHSSDQYIAKLIEKGHKVAICEQVEDPKEAKGVVRREVIRVITPGTLMEQKMLPDRENNYILFLAKSEKNFALVSCDVSTGEVMATQSSHLEEMIDEAGQFRAVEIVISPEISDEEQLQWKQSFHHPYKLSKNSYSTKENVEREWKRIAPILDVEQELSASYRTALHMMITYLEETQKRSMNHLQKVHFYQSKSYLKLDEYARRNLELTETIRGNTRKGSLLWLLDKTATAMGGRLIKKWIQRPLMDKKALEDRLDAISILIKHSLQRDELDLLLKQVYDLERLAARVSYGNVNPRDVIQLKKSLLVLPDIMQLLQSLPKTYLDSVLNSLDLCEELAQRLESALVEDAPLSIKEGGIFQKGYHQELDELLDASKNGMKWMSELEAREREITGIKSLKVGFNKVFGYYIEVTKANIAALPEGRYERKQTLANAERYVTPELKEKEELILSAKERLAELEYELFMQLREYIDKFRERLQGVAQCIAQIDVLSSFAKVSEENHYIRPIFNQQGKMSIRQGRHPVVEKVLPPASFIANDLVMDKSSREALLITGPNMAGKSTYMRQAALIVIMAQMGCYVPAEEAILPIFDQIFTRIGAADDLVGGQSTFMVEMLETKQAITHATSESLILLDEIGRGTSTYDGMSLAQAIVEYIHDHVQAKTLFSTHYHELTHLEDSLEKLTNIHVACTEKDGKVIFLHAIKEGKADRSYGIHVAQLANMPEQVIHRANQILYQLEDESNKLVDATHKMDKIPMDEDSSSLTNINNEQLSFFDMDQELQEKLKIIEQIDGLNIATLTPLEALNMLHELQQELKQKKGVLPHA